MPVSCSDTHVLIVSTKADVATDSVLAEFSALGVRATRVNTEDYPFHATTSASLDMESAQFDIATDGCAPVDLSDVSSVWYRRVRAPARPSGMNTGVYDFCLRESRSAFLGALLSLPVPFMSSPRAVWAAEHKTVQLCVARTVGLVIPRTLVSNDPSRIRSAYAAWGGRMIVKPARTGYIDYGTEQAAIYTSRVLESHLADLDSAKTSPAIYQELVDKACDVRVTIVGDKLFVAEIDSQSDAAATVDWRRTSNPDLPHARAKLPEDVARALLALMNKLGLQFGAIDLVRTRQGSYVFLEVNPNGQWLWLDDLLEFGISGHVARWLARTRLA